ncbi:MAG: hypothetical protein FJ291_31210 [Planctomycetes bacterium]|nr:hypothetical protein [Planctomycetota bacterium]
MRGKSRVNGFAVALAALAAGAGCGGLNLLSTEDEVRLGQALAKEVEKKQRLLLDPVVCGYVAEIGARIAQASDRRDVSHQFKVIDNPKQVNAFALPGGWVYVYSGLLLAMENEAELAAVLAHETGHVAAKHSAKHISNQIGMNLALGVALGANPSVLAELGSQLVTGAGIARMTQQDEFEADRLGMAYMKRAGYSPAAMAELLRKLNALRNSHRDALGQLFATHPLTADRLARANAVALSLGIEGLVAPGVYNQRLATLKARHPNPLGKKQPPSGRGPAEAAPSSSVAAGAETKKAPETKQDPPMICRNLTKGNVVVSRLAIATSWDDRRRGLLGRTSLEPGEGMLLDPCRSVHTIGMKFPIDIVFLDRDMKVVGLKAEVKPGSLNNTCLKARSTLELPAGTAAARRLELGDALQVLRADKAEEKGQ